MFRQGVASLLQDEPGLHVVGMAGTLEEATDTARARRPDVILMDHVLPNSEGAEGIRAVKEAAPDARVIIVTQFTDESHFVEAMEAGCAGFVTKDRPAEELVQAIRAVAEGEVVVPPGMLPRLLPRLHPSGTARLHDLTPRELDVLRLLARGMTHTEIATQLYLSPATIRNHIQSILTKLGVHSRLEAVTVAVRWGIVRIT